MLKKDLTPYKKFFKEYTELRVQENRTTNISLVNGNVMGNATTAKSGISARVNINGNWGFASNPVISDEAIEKVIISATENADFLGSKQSKGKIEFDRIVRKMNFTLKKKRKIKRVKLIF